MRMHKALAMAVGAAAGLLWLSAAANAAADFTYNTSATSGNWGDTANWSGGLVGDGSGKSVYCAALNSARTITLDSNRTIGQFWYNDSDGPGSGTGNTPPTTANTSLTIAGSSTLTMDWAGNTPLIYIGRLRPDSAGSPDSVTINCILAGNQGLKITTQSTPYTGQGVILGGANTISGTITYGLLTLKNPLAVQNATLAIAGSTLRLRSDTDTTFTTVGLTQTNNTTATISVDQASAGNTNKTLQLTGNLALAAARSWTVLSGNGYALEATGIISGGYSFTKLGTGTLKLSGSNSYSGGTIISAGVLQFNNANAIPGTTANVTVNANGAVASGFGVNSIGFLNRIVTGCSGAIALTTNDAAASMDFTTANIQGMSLGAVGDVSYTGSITPNGTTYRLGGGNGTLTLANTNALTSGNSLTITNGGTVILPVANDYSGGTTINSGTLSFANGTALGTGNITFTGNGYLQWNGTNTEDISSRIQPIGAGATAGFDTNMNNVTFATALTGSGSLAKVGNGTLTLSVTNSYTGGTSLSGGTLIISNVGAMGTGSLNLTGGTIQAASALGGPITNTLSTLTCTLGGTNAMEFSGTWTMAADNTVTVTNTGGVTLSGVIGGAFKLTKDGPETLTLSNANTYTGGTTLTAGTLVVGNNSALGTGTLAFNAGTLTANSPVTLANAVTLGGAATIGGSQNLTISGNVVNSGGSYTLTVNNSAATELASNVYLSESSTTGRTLTISGSGNTTISGVVANNSGSNTTSSFLTKSGTGTLRLSNTNTYTGTTTISGGVLRAEQGVGLGSGYLSISGGVWESSADMVRPGGNQPGQMKLTAGTGGFSSANPAGVNVAFGSVASPESLTWGAGNFSPTTLVLNAATATGPLDFKNPIALGTALRTINVNAQTATISGIVSGGTGGGISKGGAGTLKLGAANTYTGGTTVTGGILAISDNNNLGAASGALTLNGGTLQTLADVTSARGITVGASGGAVDTNGHNIVLNGNLTTTGMLTKTGTGVLQLANLPTVGQINVTGGTALLTATAADAQEAAFASHLPQPTMPTSASISAYTTGVLTNTEWIASHGASFTGANSDSLILQNALAGDTNLDGKITMDDYLALDTGYLFGGTVTWASGDFTHDGLINADDYAFIDHNFKNQSGASADDIINLHAAWFGDSYTTTLDTLAAIPEPTSLALLALGAVSLLKRRR